MQRYLAQMVTAGLTHAIVEATSHGLDQHRVDACEFDVTVLTNITREHLDYHHTFEAYRSAKLRLFTDLIRRQPKANGISPIAVLNLDDASYKMIAEAITIRHTSYGMQPWAAVHAVEILNDAEGMHFIVEGPGFRLPVRTALVGQFNVSNCLAAISTAVVGLGLRPEDARAGIASLQGVPGRMERISLGQGFTVIVDFAHTPNALRRALQATRQLTQKRVIAVFGSAGLRDPGKRQLMARASVELADLTVLTAEDPRTESLDSILDEMAAGALSQGGVEGKDFWRIPDRGKAIRFAIRMAEPGDAVILCGKGHEQSMCFGTTEYPWDDRTAARAALAEALDLDGPAMPYLPTEK